MKRNLEVERLAREKCKELAVNVGVPEEEMDSVEVKFAYMSNIVVGGLEDEGTEITEMAIIMSAKTPNGLQPVFNTAIKLDDNALEAIEKVFPSKEDIDKEREAQQAQYMMRQNGDMPSQEMIDEAMKNMEIAPVEVEENAEVDVEVETK